VIEEPDRERTERPPKGCFVTRQILLAVALLAALWLLWRLADVLLLVMAAVIVAVVIRSLSDPLVRHLRLAPKAALSIIMVFLIASLAGGTFFFGARIAGELVELAENVPVLINQLGERFGISDAGQRLSAWAAQFVDGGLFLDVAGYTISLAGVATAGLVVFFGGIFLAFGTETYIGGVLLLVPERQRPRFRQVFEEVGRSLRLWLLGQLSAMVLVGLASFVGLVLLGVPSALALGILAGLLEFVPFVGALVAFAVAFLVALGHDPWLALWVTLLYVAIQQVESNLLVPLIQQHTVSLPPALGLFSIIAVGTLFGPLGILLAVPLTIVVLVAVRRFYVEGLLGKPMRPLSED